MKPISKLKTGIDNCLITINSSCNVLDDYISTILQRHSTTIKQLQVSARSRIQGHKSKHLLTQLTTEFISFTIDVDKDTDVVGRRDRGRAFGKFGPWPLGER